MVAANDALLFIVINRLIGAMHVVYQVDCTGVMKVGNMRSEKEKMLAGAMYNAADPVLVHERHAAHSGCRAFNLNQNHNVETMSALFALFGAVGTSVHIESPFLCDYGYNIFLGDRVYFNFNVTILDCAPVTIGNDVKLGPGVQLYTAGHSLDVDRRRAGDEFAMPITIGDDVWIGGSAVILPGITIGDGAVIGAGAVVTKNVESASIVVGNPATVRQSR